MAYALLILITLINPLIGGFFAIVDMIIGKNRWKIDVICLALVFANLSYCYTPESIYPDLFRYFQYIDRMHGVPFADALFSNYEGSSLYVFNFFVWLANCCEDPHIVPAISVFLVYYISFYCTCYYGERENIKKLYILLYMLIAVLCLDWYSITNNVRNISAFAVIGYAIFRDVYMKKIDVLTILCYVLPIFVHPTAVLFLAVRAVLLIMRTNRARMIVVILAVFISPIVSILQRNIQRITNNQLLIYVIRKAYNYLFDTSSAYGLSIQNSTRSLVTRILFLSLVAVICIIQFRFSRISKEQKIITSKTSQSFITYVLITGLMALACTFMLRPEYWRFSATVIIFGGAIICPYFASKNRHYLDYGLKAVYLTLVPLCAAVVWYQLTWLDYPKLAVDAFYNCPLLVIGRDFVTAIGLGG